MDIKYFEISAAVGTKETGMAYPSIVYPNEVDNDSDFSIHKLDSRAFPDFTPLLEFKLNKGAKICDMMSNASAAKGFFVNEKLLHILSKFELCPHKIYDAKIMVKDQMLNYFWVQFVWPESIDYVDYPNSEFYTKTLIEGKFVTQYYQFNSFKDRQKKVDELGAYFLIKNKRIKFLPHNYDLFVSHLTHELYCTQTVKNVIEQNFITGVEFIEV